MSRKPKATRATESAMPDPAPAPARRGRPPRTKAAPKPTEAESSSAPRMAAETATSLGTAPEPVEAGMTRSEHRDAEAQPAAPSPTMGEAPSKPAAQWDAAADTVQFDWPEIERTASRPGPNQLMAKLLIAARTEGVSSRWPFQA